MSGVVLYLEKYKQLFFSSFICLCWVTRGSLEMVVLVWTEASRGHDQYMENACSRIISLFFFILRFWNQIFTCWSLKSSLSDSSFLFCLFMNSFIINSFSSSASCGFVYGFLFFLGFTCEEHQGAPERKKKHVFRNLRALNLEWKSTSWRTQSHAWSAITFAKHQIELWKQQQLMWG